MNETNVQIANKLKELRKSHGYTQEYIAANIDVTQPTYQQYESGKRRPGTTSLYKLANFYGLTTDELLKLCIPLDDDIYYEAPAQTARSLEEAEFSSYGSSKRLESFSPEEIKLLFYFSKLSKASKEDLIQYAKFRAAQDRQN